MKWFGRKRAEKLPGMDKSKIVVIDTETTGFNPKTNDILQIAILDGNGRQLYDSYIQPIRRKSWKSAQKTNGISWDMVKEAPTFSKIKNDIQKILDSAILIVGYNINFDLNFLQNEGVVITGKTFDVMYEFANYRKKLDGTAYRTCKLVECAEYFDYLFCAHNAREDAEATLHCFNQLICRRDFTLYEKGKIENDRQVPKTKYTIKLPTRKRKPTIIWGILCVALGELLYHYANNTFLLDYEKILVILKGLIENFTIIYPENVAILLIVIGIVFLVVGLIKVIVRIPKYFLSVVRRILNKFI